MTVSRLSLDWLARICSTQPINIPSIGSLVHWVSNVNRWGSCSGSFHSSLLSNYAKSKQKAGAVGADLQVFDDADGLEFNRI